MANLASFREFCADVGMPLAPFQDQIAEGFWTDERTFVVLLPKGQAKTTLAALRAVWELLHVPHPFVLIGAASREQAHICFEAAREVARHPAIDGRILIRHLELRGPGGGLLRVASSDGSRSHAPTPSLSITDELWCHSDAGLYQVDGHGHAETHRVAAGRALHGADHSRLHAGSGSCSRARRGCQPIGRHHDRHRARPCG